MFNVLKLIEGEAFIHGEFDWLEDLSDEHLQKINIVESQPPAPDFVGVVFVLSLFALPVWVISGFINMAPPHLLWITGGWLAVSLAAFTYLALRARRCRLCRAISSEQYRRRSSGSPS
jgi:hypothetical protein